MNEINQEDSENMKSSDTSQIQEQLNQTLLELERYQLMNNLQSDGQFRLMAIEMFQRVNLTLSSLKEDIKKSSERQYQFNEMALQTTKELIKVVKQIEGNKRGFE